MPENVNTSELVLNQEAEPEDNRPVMIKVDHVSMSFNMASEQMNSLKEYAVAIAKRKLFFEEFKALDDVSFEVRKGDVFGIMGTNGSGKSTMLKIIAGVLEPTKGTCQVNGNIAPLIELGAGFDMDLSARENIYLNGALLGYSKQFIDENFDAIVEFAEVEKFLDMPLKNYSSGMVARIAFAIATVIVPEILVVDEVLSVGDFMFQKKCEDRITELIERHGVTVLIVSHNNEQISRLCNKAIWVEKGHERLQGDASMVCRVYGGLGGRIGSAEAELQIFDALVQSGTCSGEISFATLAAGSPSGLSVKMIEEAWKSKGTETLVVAVDNTHLNALVANSVAGALCAPMLSVGSSVFTDAVSRFLYEFSPKKILVYDISNVCSWAQNRLSALPWEPEVRIISGEGETARAFCLQVFSEGKLEGLWRGDTFALIDFNEVPESLAMMPYLYAHKIPVIADEFSDELLSSTQALVQDCSTHSVLCSGSGLRARLRSLVGDGVSIVAVSEDFIMANVSQGQEGSLSIYMAPYSPSQWPYLLTSGCCLGKINGVLFLLDQTKLDDMAHGITVLRENCKEIGSITFIDGLVSFDEADKEAFAWQVMS